MLIEGSCHCKAVRFRLESHTPVPFMACCCSACRKTAGSAAGIMGTTESFVVEGEEHVGTYRVRVDDPEAPGGFRLGPIRRVFCRECGSALWGYNPEWGDLVYPVATAVDTPLLQPKDRTFVFVGSKAPWVELPEGDHIKHFDEFPDESIEGWHRARGLFAD
jgi:hypothetical protein